MSLAPNGAPPGYYYQAGATAYTEDPAGTYSLAGATAPIADPGGTYSAAGASAPTADRAGTYSSPYALDRLFLITNNIALTSSVLSFQSATAVANYFGATSDAASLANEFFADYGPSATMLISRYGFSGARPHLYGANLSNLTLNQLQSTSGPLSIAFDGYTYSGSINLSGVASFSAAATAIQNTLNSSVPVAATTTGSSIAPVSVSFTGSMQPLGSNGGFLLQVTSVSGGSLEPGAEISGPGIGAFNQILNQWDGTPGGPGLYELTDLEGPVPSETMTESYGVLTVGSVTSGTVAVGELVTGPGVASTTAVEDNLSGSGAGSTWLVNNAQTVAPENLTMMAPSLSVLYNSIVGATANRDYFDVQPNYYSGFDYNPSSLSFMGDTAAAASLGLTQASGALVSTPGGQQTSAAAFMNNLVQNENSEFGSFQTNYAQLAQEDPEFQGDLAAWAQSTGGPYQFLSNTGATPPAGSSVPTTDPAGTYSGPGASAPTPAAAGTYIPVTGATSIAAQIADPAGTYSGAGASAPTRADPGTYIPFTGATSEAVEIADPAGTYSGAGASAPVLAAAGTYIPGAGATSSAAQLVDPAGSYSGAGASAPTLAQPGYYVPTGGASSETPDDPGYYTPYAGMTTEFLAQAPVISSTAPGRSTPAGQPDTPFSSVIITDPNIDTSDSLSIQPTGAGGALADGAGFSGLTTSAPGVYLLSGTAAAITSELDALVFTPSAGSGTTTFTLTDTTSIGMSASDADTTVTVAPVSVSAFLADQPTLDQTAGGFAISDTASNITANLNQLDDPNIDAITISDDGQVGASVQQLTSDATVIGKLNNASSAPMLLAILDSAGNIEAGLSTLVADIGEIGSIAASGGPVAVSMSTFLADQSALDKIVGGFVISDTASDVVQNLGALSADPNITSIAASNGPVVVSAATFLDDQSALNEIVGGFAISDTASNIMANLNQLSDPNIDAITISDNGQVQASVQQLSSDAAAIGKLENANSSPVLLAISDNAGNIEAGLSTLVADFGEIGSITASSGPVAVSTTTFQADQPTLDEIVGGLAISDTAADISAALNSLGDPEINSITISDNAPVGASIAQLTNDATAIGKLENASGGAYQLAIADTASNVLAALATLEGDVGHIASIIATGGPVIVSVSTFSADQSALDKIAGGFDISDTAANVVAKLSALDADSHVAAITVTSDSVRLSGGAVVNASNFSETGSGTILTVAEALGYAGAFSQGAGSALNILSADTLSLTGTASLSGTTSGPGTLAMAGGSDSINGGATFGVSNWSISGAGTSVTLGEALSYGKSFSEAAGDTLALSGGHLVLSGAATFAGGTVDGSNFLYTDGTTTVSGGLTIGGTAEWENINTVNQSGGMVAIGDSSGERALFDNTAKGTYDILDNSGIARGSSTASYIANAGVFEKTGGTGTSTITPAVTNTGTLNVTSGTLDLMGAVTGKGTDMISGPSTLEFDGAVASSKTLGDQNIGFTGGGTLDLTDPNAFWGEISSFAATDAIELLGSWAFSSFSENAGGTLASLTLASGATKHAFDFVGDYALGDFKIVSGATSTITYT